MYNHLDRNVFPFMFILFSAYFFVLLLKNPLSTSILSKTFSIRLSRFFIRWKFFVDLIKKTLVHVTHYKVLKFSDGTNKPPQCLYMFYICYLTDFFTEFPVARLVGSLQQYTESTVSFQCGLRVQVLLMLLLGTCEWLVVFIKQRSTQIRQ